MKKRWKEDSAAQLTELAALLATQPEDLPSEATEEVVKAWIEEKGYGSCGDELLPSGTRRCC